MATPAQLEQYKIMDEGLAKGLGEDFILEMLTKWWLGEAGIQKDARSHVLHPIGLWGAEDGSRTSINIGDRYCIFRANMGKFELHGEASTQGHQIANYREYRTPFSQAALKYEGRVVFLGDGEATPISLSPIFLNE